MIERIDINGLRKQFADSRFSAEHLGEVARRVLPKLLDRITELEKTNRLMEVVLHQASFRLCEYRKICGCLSMRGICPRCTKTLAIENNIDTALKDKP